MPEHDRKTVLLIEVQEALLREKQKNIRLQNKLRDVCSEIHSLSERLHRMEYGISSDGIGELNAYGIHQTQ